MLLDWYGGLVLVVCGCWFSRVWRVLGRFCGLVCGWLRCGFVAWVVCGGFCGFVCWHLVVGLSGVVAADLSSVWLGCVVVGFTAWCSG